MAVGGTKEAQAATTGNLDQAEAAWKKSLYQEMGHPNAKKVQQWLYNLAK